jgi:hypothetical protein
LGEIAVLRAFLGHGILLSMLAFSVTTLATEMRGSVDQVYGRFNSVLKNTIAGLPQPKLFSLPRR